MPLGPYSTFRGVVVDDTTVLIAYARTADANLDGIVNDDDVTIVGATYSPGAANPQWAFGDFDFNGFVDDDDATLLGVFYEPAAAALTPPRREPGTEVVRREWSQVDPALVDLLAESVARDFDTSESRLAAASLPKHAGGGRRLNRALHATFSGLAR